MTFDLLDVAARDVRDLYAQLRDAEKERDRLRAEYSAADTRCDDLRLALSQADTRLGLIARGQIGAALEAVPPGYQGGAQ